MWTALLRATGVVASFFRDWLAGDVTEAQMHSALGGGIDGTLCDLVCLPQTAWLPIPAHLSFAEAATLPCAAVTRVAGAGYAGPGQSR